MSCCILALETSTAVGSVAVRRDGETLFSENFTSERGHNSVIFAPLERALAVAGALDWIVVGTGPGSYTGVRIGIAAALGISLAKNLPVLGQTSFAAMDEENGRLAVISDARRGQWQFSELNAGVLTGETLLGNADEIAARCAAFGDPVLTIDSTSPAFWDARCVKPSAELLARSVETWSEEKLRAMAGLPLEPIYLSGPFITMPKSARAIQN